MKTALITGSYGGLGTCLVNIHAADGGHDYDKKTIESSCCL